MATTAGHFAIQTPRSEAAAGESLNSINAEDITFGSQEASFASPSKQKAQQQKQEPPQKFLARLQQSTATPLGEIKNNARPLRKQEFTPLLKSATKNQFLKHGFAAQTPSKLRMGLHKAASTSDLHEITEMMSHVSSSAEEADATQDEKGLADMSSVSVSFQKLPTRSPGSADGGALLTLREQEKVIDEYKKENFSLKLKIFFMQDRLSHLAPEHYQAVFKENIEYKVEQTKLQTDLKKYKRALQEAERNVIRMAEEIKATKNNPSGDPSIACPLEHGMSEEEAAMLKAAQEEAEENKNEAMFAKKEVEELKRELWETRRQKQKLEEQADVAVWEKQVDELKGVNEDLQLEVGTLKEQVELKEEELDVLQDQLNEAKQKVEELEAHPSSGDDEELAQELKDSRQEVATLRQKIVELETNLNEMQTEFQHEKDQLQDMAAEHKTLYEKVDHDLEVLQEEYENLNKELDEKQEEIESYQEQLQKAGGVDAVEFQRLKIQVKDLQNEIHQVNIEKEYLEDQIESLKRDASQLIEKDGRVARERSEERKNLQTVTELSCTSDVQEIENLQQRLKDAQDQKTLIQQQLETYIAEDDDGDEKIQKALRAESDRHQLEISSLQRQIAKLTTEVQEGRKLNNDLESEIHSLNEEIRTNKLVQDSLNQDLREMRDRVANGSRDSEYLRKLQSENGEFKVQIATLQGSLDAVSAQRDRLAAQVLDLQAKFNNASAVTQKYDDLEKQFGSVRAERDDLRVSTMQSRIDVAKLKAQVNDLTAHGSRDLEQQLSAVTRERDSLESQVKSLQSQLDDTKRQVDLQTSRLRTVEHNLEDARKDLEHEQEHAQNLLSLQTSSPGSDKTRRLNGEIKRLEESLQQARARQAELGKVNAGQLEEISSLNRRVERLQGELDAVQNVQTHHVAGRDEKALHSQLTIAKGQLAEAREQLAELEADLAKRVDEKVAEYKANHLDDNDDLRKEIDRLRKRQADSALEKAKLEDEIRHLTRQVSRLESGPRITSAGVGSDNQDLIAKLQKELDFAHEDAEQRENKSTRLIRRLQVELDTLRDQIDQLTHDLRRTQQESERHLTRYQTVAKQLQDSRETVRRLKSTNTIETHHVPSALSSQVEKRHASELRGLGKQIRYLKAKLFREETFRIDLQYTKKFILMQVACFESFNKVNLRLLEQMGIYPDRRIKARRPKFRSVALFVVAMARMRRLKDDWAEHQKAGKELKESLKRIKGRRGIVA